ncbi:plasmid pRiA4b ORF-3 family protein, partial [Sphingomonas sp.]|uniref:plasmid pRiA4b ORF-3 family protein n=1 Tax=Sphingomonas sp. TaxID=28214 RepID=UPI002EDB76F2
MSTIARLKITLQDVEPKVLRQIEVPVDLRLDRLHQVLQAALGWTSSHLHEFRAGRSSWGTSGMGGPFDDRVHSEKRATLQDL